MPGLPAVLTHYREHLASLRMITHAARMDSKPFLESCRRENERELKTASSVPSREEIETVKGQIRTENDAREANKRCSPPYLRMYREPKIRRTSYSAGRRITRHL
jgi:hypothetical protein